MIFPEVRDHYIYVKIIKWSRRVWLVILAHSWWTRKKYKLEKEAKPPYIDSLEDQRYCGTHRLEQLTQNCLKYAIFGEKDLNFFFGQTPRNTFLFVLFIQRKKNCELLYKSSPDLESILYKFQLAFPSMESPIWATHSTIHLHIVVVSGWKKLMKLFKIIPMSVSYILLKLIEWKMRCTILLKPTRPHISFA